MKIKREFSRWRDALHFGPFIEWQEWNIWRHEFTIGFSFGPWDFGLKIILWDVEETVEVLQSRGMTKDEAWDFCDAVRNKLPDPYDGRVNLREKIEKALIEVG